MLAWFFRFCFGVVIIGMATGALFAFEGTPYLGVVAFLAILAVGVVAVAVDLFVPNKQITTISALYFGLLLGLLLGALFSHALEPILIGYLPKEPSSLAPKVVQLMRFLVTIICCYVSVTTLLQTKDEFRFIIPYVEFSKQVKGAKPLVLDTSVIIDGRIADICDTRIIDTKLLVPKFVLQELQAIADSSDKLKRNRGRRGLDILKRMQGNAKIELIVHEGNLPELRDVHKVDEKIVTLAKSLGARVMTNDLNLNKIAQLQGVEVINLNEVANALKTVALPGESIAVRLVRPGEQPGQGVGYMEDGTMVVVENGKGMLGQEVGIVVTSVLQTPAGRMVFGKLDPARRPAGASEGGDGAPRVSVAAVAPSDE